MIKLENVTFHTAMPRPGAGSDQSEFAKASDKEDGLQLTIENIEGASTVMMRCKGQKPIGVPVAGNVRRWSPKDEPAPAKAAKP